MKFVKQIAVLSALCLALTLTGAGLAVQAQAQDRTPDVPYVPTPEDVVEAMLKLANVRKGETVIDLGCGDGRIVVMAAQKFGARAIGVDINPERIEEANENARKAGVTDRVQFIQGDLFEADVKPANVVTLYLLPGVNERLKPKLLQDLRPGSRVVSHSFLMGDWEPEKEDEVNGRKIYLWTIPAGRRAATAK